MLQDNNIVFVLDSEFQIVSNECLNSPSREQSVYDPP